MLGPDLLLLAGGLLETPHRPQRMTKEQLLAFIAGWAPRRVEQTSDLTTAYLP
jgi:hypothetical protein